MNQPAELEGRLAIVTGGGNGIGSAVVDELRSRGARVVAVDLAFGDLADASVAAATPDGTDLVRIEGDVTDPATVRRALDAALGLPGRLSILVQSVFTGSPTPLDQLTDEQWDGVHDVLLGASRRFAAGFVAAVGFADASAPDADAEPWDAAIVNVASPHAFGAVAGFAAYASAKAGLLALTRAAAVEWGPRGVRCNAVAPGFIPVERNKHVWGDEAVCKQLLRGSPLGRFGTAAEVARAVAFLAGPQGSFVNGVCLAVDGGMTAMLPEALLR